MCIWQIYSLRCTRGCVIGACPVNDIRAVTTEFYSLFILSVLKTEFLDHVHFFGTLRKVTRSVSQCFLTVEQKLKDKLSAENVSKNTKNLNYYIQNYNR